MLGYFKLHWFWLTFTKGGSFLLPIADVENRWQSLLTPKRQMGFLNPLNLLPDGVYKHITISLTSFEQKRGNSVWVIENKWSAYGKMILSRIHS